MKQDSKSWIWLLLFLYAMYAAYWGQQLSQFLARPLKSSIELPALLIPISRALLG